MSDVMLTFGPVSFSVASAAYQALRRATRYRVPSHERIGSPPGYQFTGRGEDGVTLSGVIMPTYRGRPALLDELRALAGEGESQILTTGTGENLGRWIMDELTEERSGLFSRGEARKIAFTVKLMRDDDTPSGRLEGLETAAAANGNVRAVVDATAAAVARGDDSPGVIASAQGAA